MFKSWKYYIGAILFCLDFISNLTMARNGAPRMAIAACYGGPLLSIFSIIGLPVIPE